MGPHHTQPTSLESPIRNIDRWGVSKAQRVRTQGSPVLQRLPDLQTGLLVLSSGALFPLSPPLPGTQFK